MKYLFSILMVTLLITSCKPKCSGNSTTTHIDDGSGYDYDVVRIGKCQYIDKNKSRLNSGITHKGDCDNPFHLGVREKRTKIRKDSNRMKQIQKEKKKRQVKAKKLRESEEDTYKELEY